MMTMHRQCQEKSEAAGKIKPEIHLNMLSLHLTVTRQGEKHGIAPRDAPHLQCCSFQHKAHIQEYPLRNTLKE